MSGSVPIFVRLDPHRPAGPPTSSVGFTMGILRVHGVGAVGGRLVRLVSVAAASRGTQTCRGMGPGSKRNTTTIGYAHRSIN